MLGYASETQGKSELLVLNKCDEYDGGSDVYKYHAERDASVIIQENPHKNIIAVKKIHEIYGDDDQARECYIALEYFGKSVSEHFKVTEDRIMDKAELYARRDDWSVISNEDEMYQFLKQVFTGLQYIHRGMGWYHGDIKLDNIVVHDGCYKIIDFGLAAPLQSEWKRTHEKGDFMPYSSKWGAKADCDIMSISPMVERLLCGRLGTY